MLSLKETCLKFISGNLSRYNAAYCTTEDADLKWNLEYLRRFHTLHVTEEHLKSNRHLDKSYFNFLINEYLEELKLSIFCERDWDEVIRRTIEVGHAFRKVTGDSFVWASGDIRMRFVNTLVRNIPNVKKLVLITGCNDTTLEIIASFCPELEELNIDGSSVTNDGLECLCRSGTEAKGLNLKTLCLWNVKDIEDGIGFLLQNMPSLENIDHSDLPNVLYRMHSYDNNISQTKYNLRSLDIYCNTFSGSVTDMLAVVLEVCHRVKNLFLDECSLKRLEFIKRFSELENLCIVGDKLRPLDCSSFLKPKGWELRKLILERLQVSADILIQSCPKVEILHFHDVTFQPLGQASVLTPLYRLRELSLIYLNFNETRTEQSLITVLKSSASLRELSFHDCKFGNPEKILTILAEYREKSALKTLTFYYCDIDEVLLKSVISTLFDFERTRLIVMNELFS